MKLFISIIALITISSHAQLGMVDRGIIVPNGLVGYYTLNPGDNRNSQAIDRSAGGINVGFITNSCVQSNGIIDGAIAFNGSTGAILFTNGAIFGTGSNKAFTVAFWMYPKSFANYCNIFRTGKTADNQCLILGVHDSSHYYIDTWFHDYEPSGPTTLNIWTHVTLTADGTNFNLYCNSILTNTTARNPNFTADATVLGQGLGGFPRQFTGVLDDVRLYNRTLTAAEIYSIFKARH